MLTLLIIILGILATYFVISVFVWPFLAGKTRRYTAGYATANAVACAVLAIVMFGALAALSGVPQ